MLKRMETPVRYNIRKLVNVHIFIAILTFEVGLLVGGRFVGLDVRRLESVLVDETTHSV